MTVDEGVAGVLDEVRRLDPGDGEYVEFATAGSAAPGAYRCSSCGYGVTIQAALPRCPMCGGTSWEAAAASFYSRPVDRLP